MIRKIKRDAAVAVANRLHADPDNFAGGCEGVEISRVVAVDPRGQDLRLQNRCGERRALQLFDGIQKGIGAVPPQNQTLPLRRESAEHLLVDRLDFVPQLRQRSPSKQAEHVRVGPFALDAARPELAFENSSLFGQGEKHSLERRRGDSVPGRELRGGEGRVRAREAKDEVRQRIGGGFEERGGDAGRKRDAEGVPVSRGVLDGDISGLFGNAHRENPSGGRQRFGFGGGFRVDGARPDFFL